MSNDTLRALQSGEVTAAILSMARRTRRLESAARSNLKLMNFRRADAYHRRFAHISKLTVPPGAIDFAQNIPPDEIALIGTKAMLAARDGCTLR
jgi:hypothetical protein